MKVAMIYPNHLWGNETNYQLGLAMLTTILRRTGHDARYYVYYDKRQLQEIQQFNPDVLGYYWLEFQTELIRNIINTFKDKIHVAGGPYPTLRKDAIKELPLTAMFRGEADRGLLRWIESGCKDTTIKGFVFPTHVNEVDTQLSSDELNQLPMVEREPYTSLLLQADRVKRWESKYHGAIHFTAGRGCPYSCRFCANSVYNDLWSPSVRLRSARQLINEIIEVSNKYTFGTVLFTDDIMTVDEKWFNEFMLLYCTKIRDKYKKTLILNTRVDCITMQQMQLLKDARCVLLRAGIESGSTRIRALMGRPMTSDDIYGIFCKMIDAGLRTYSYNMLGFPSETIEDWKETYELNVKIDAYAKARNKRHLGMINVFYPYKGTPIGDECYARGIVDTDFIKWAHPHYDYTLINTAMTKEQVETIRGEWPFNHGG